MTTVDHTDIPPAADEEPRRLRRSRDNRVLTGVAGGLAEYFGLSATVYRVLFVALTFAGGTGLLLYAAAALVLPAEGDDASALEQTLQRNRHRPWLVIVLALVALLVVFSLSGDWWGGGFGPGAILVLVLIGGVTLAWARATRRDSQRREATGRRSVRWRLGVLALLLTLLLAAVAGAAVAAAHLQGGIGDDLERPRSAAELEDEYRLGFGRLRVDLTELDVPAGETRVEASVAFGELEIAVPADVAVDVDAAVRWGELEVLGRRADGDDLRERFVDPGFDGAARRLVVEADVGGGELVVTR